MTRLKTHSVERVLTKRVQIFVALLCLFTLPASADQTPLSEDERRTLDRYEAQEQAYQTIAIKHIKSQISGLEREIRDTKRDKEQSEPARDRMIDHLQEQIDHLEEISKKMSDGDLTLPPQLNCSRIRTGHFGTIQPTDQQFKGYGYKTTRDAISGYRYVYDADNRGKGHQAYLHSVDAEGKELQQVYGVIFEVVERLDRYKGKPTFRIRAIDIEALRNKRDLELENKTSP